MESWLNPNNDNVSLSAISCYSSLPWILSHLPIRKLSEVRGANHYFRRVKGTQLHDCNIKYISILHKVLIVSAAMT